MMKLATVTCPNPACNGKSYDAVVENDGFLAECPTCHQFNRIAGKDIGKPITGLCEACGKPLDELHIFGRHGFVCPPKKGKR
jgi:hypothetical protein